MASNSDNVEDIVCQIFPIPTAGNGRPSGSVVSKHALFFHRLSEQVAKSSDCANIPRCFVHHDNVAVVQCMDCVKFGLPLKQSYYCSNKCFLDSWKKHILYHLCARFSHYFNDDVKEKHDSWPPADMVSWFDERIEVILPGDKKLVNRIGTANILVPVADDVGFSFKLVSAVLGNRQDALLAKDVFVTDHPTHRLSPPPRCMIWLADLKKPEKFDERYYYCPQWAPTWEYRRENLLHEIMLYDADILCLQEVQSDHFENFLKPKLASFGYSAVYKKKTKEVYTSTGCNIDGCAIFFLNDKFKAVRAYELEYSKSALSLVEKLEACQRDQARLRLIKDNIALAVILEMVENASGHGPSWSRLCVVNTHIHADKHSPDVKLLQ